MTLLGILYWLILIISAVAYTIFHWVYALPIAVLLLFILIGLKIFKTPIE